MVCTGCCATLDHIVTHLFKQMSLKAGKVRRGQTMPENDALVQVVKMHPEILQQMLSTVLNILMFEDCRNQWSMSRPLLGLILLNEDYFQSLRDQVRITFTRAYFCNDRIHRPKNRHIQNPKCAIKGKLF